jgi:hypothetical protein
LSGCDRLTLLRGLDRLFGAGCTAPRAWRGGAAQLSWAHRLNRSLARPRLRLNGHRHRCGWGCPWRLRSGWSRTWDWLLDRRCPGCPDARCGDNLSFLLVWGPQRNRRRGGDRAFGRLAGSRRLGGDGQRSGTGEPLLLTDRCCGARNARCRSDGSFLGCPRSSRRGIPRGDRRGGLNGLLLARSLLLAGGWRRTRDWLFAMWIARRRIRGLAGQAFLPRQR